MSTISLVTGFYSKSISHLDTLVYNANGSASPFVLTSKANFIFSVLQKFHSLKEEQLIKLANNKKITSEEVNEIIDEFLTEKIVTVESPTTRSSQQFSNKRTVTNGKKLTFWIHITDRCQLRCDYCYICKGKRTMSMEVFRTLLETIKDNVGPVKIEAIHFKFAGGEPLLRFGLLKQMVSEAKEQLLSLGLKVSFSIITNTLRVTRPICDFLKEEKFTVSVSVDGLGKYNNARKYPNGKNSYNNVALGIKTYLKNGIRPHILTVISNQSVSGLNKLITLVTKLNLHITLILCRGVTEDGSLVINVNRTKRKLLRVLRRLKKLPANKLPMLDISTLRLKGKRNSACAAGKSYFSVNPSGGIGSCQMVVDEPIINNMDSSLRFQDIPSKCFHRSLPPECTACMWKYICAGGCSVLASKTGSLLNKSPLCPIIKAIVPELLQIEGRRIQILSERR